METSPRTKRSRRRGYAPKLGWYLSRLWLANLGLTMLGLGSFIYMATVSELLRQLGSQGVNAATVAVLALLKVPDLLLQLLPFGILVASLVWLNGLNKRHELVALRASGLPARRFLAAPVIMCFIVCLCALGIGNPVAATLLKRYESVHNSLTPESVRSTVTGGGNIWLKQENQQRKVFIYGQNLQASGSQMGPATVFIFTASNTLEARFDATSATLVSTPSGNAWNLRNVTYLRPNQPAQTEPSLNLPTRLTAAELASSLNPPATLNAWELWNYLVVLGKSGLPLGVHMVALANVLALPLLGVTMMLLAIPFGLRFSRNRGVISSIAVGIAMGFGFYVLKNVASAYAVAGRLDAVMAALVPIAVGALVAVAMMVYLREE